MQSLQLFRLLFISTLKYLLHIFFVFVIMLLVSYEYTSKCCVVFNVSDYFQMDFVDEWIGMILLLLHFFLFSRNFINSANPINLLCSLPNRERETHTQTCIHTQKQTNTETDTETDTKSQTHLSLTHKLERIFSLSLSSKRRNFSFVFYVEEEKAGASKDAMMPFNQFIGDPSPMQNRFNY